MNGKSSNEEGKCPVCKCELKLRCRTCDNGLYCSNNHHIVNGQEIRCKGIKVTPRGNAYRTLPSS